MQPKDFIRLFAYNYWANGAILAKVALVAEDKYARDSDYSHGSLRSTLLHILSAEWVWRVRCEEGVSPTSLLRVTEFPTLTKLRERWDDEQKRMWSYLDTLEERDLNRIISYTRVGGEMEENVLWHILIHIVLHGTEHRSEAAALLTRFGHSPGDIDLIHFLRGSAR